MGVLWKKNYPPVRGFQRRTSDHDLALLRARMSPGHDRQSRPKFWLRKFRAVEGRQRVSRLSPAVTMANACLKEDV